MAWQRVTKREPCPICERPDWCSVSDDGGVAICARVQSSKRAGEAGWLHHLRDRPQFFRPRPLVVKQSRPTMDLSLLAGQCQAAAEELGMVERLADELGVSSNSLRRLGVGWLASESCWTFPLADHAGRVLGLNRRYRNGSKKIMHGHRAGIYLPDLPGDLSGQTLLIVEGGSDTAAALDLGFLAVGRCSCTHGGELLRRLLRQSQPEAVVIIADTDEQGQRGAANLAMTLVADVAELRIITPPRKDVRAWKQAGATHNKLQDLIDSTEPLSLCVTMKGG